jgi:hypothetical protein
MTREGNPYKVLLQERPVAAGSVAIDYDWTGRFRTNAVTRPLTEGCDYDVDYEEGVITILTGFPFNRRGLRIAYTAGFDPDDGTPAVVQVPATIQRAVAMQAVFTLRRLKGSQMGEDQQEKSRQSLQKFTVSATTGLISEVQGMLLRHRAPLIGST